MPVINPAYWLLAILISAGLAGWYGYSQGVENGALEVQAKVDAQAVSDLNTILASHKALVRKANRAGQRLQAATARRQQYDQKATREIRDALAETAAQRADCLFPADVMRQLNAARDRAARAAAAGVTDTVPEPAAGTGQ